MKLSTSEDLKEVHLCCRATGYSAHFIEGLGTGPCKQDVPEQEKMERMDGEPKTPLASPSSTM